MTVQQRLSLHYGIVTLLALALLAGLWHHEFITEKRLRAGWSAAQRAEAERGEMVEVIVCASIPALLIVGWWLTRRSLAPLSSLARRVERIQADNLHEPLPRTGNGDEIDRLTEAFNEMIARLDQSFQRVHWFTLHASHELKTPLTVMRSELESVAQQAPWSAPRQRDTLDSLLDEIQRLAKIVDGLSLLTRADTGQLILKRQPVPLAQLMRESFDDALILAEPQRISVALTECAELRVLGDRHRLRQLLLNLTDNAVKYNHPGGTIRMTLRRVQGWAEISVSNTGPGIPPALQTRVFDRFFRADPAGDRAAEGCGLGLSIAQGIAQAHGGTIQARSEPGKETVFVVRLPLAFPSGDSSF